jgi:WD40 repeat protein
MAVGYQSSHKKLGKLIRVINCDTGGLFVKLMAHSADVLALAKLDNSQMASGSVDKSIKIWNWKRGMLLKNLTHQAGQVFDLVSLLNGHLISCSDQRPIKVWNINKSEPFKYELKGHYDSVRNLILLNNEQLLASCSGDETIRIWNVTSGKQSRLFSNGNGVGSPSGVRSLLALNKTHLLSGGFNGKIKMWNIQGGKMPVKILSGHSNGVNSLVFLVNGHLASASNDKSLRIWDLESETLIKILYSKIGFSIFCLAVLKDGNLASGFKDDSIKIFHFSNTSNYSSKLKLTLSYIEN